MLKKEQNSMNNKLYIWKDYSGLVKMVDIQSEIVSYEYIFPKRLRNHKFSMTKTEFESMAMKPTIFDMLKLSE